MNKVLEIKNVTKTYKIYKNNFDRLKEVFTKKKYHKEFIANNNLSFDLLEGESLGIIGVNGAGKSTILKMIAGVVQPTFGSIVSTGRVTALLELGTGFNAELSGIDNIDLNATLIGMTQKEIQTKKDAIIAFSELGDYIYEPLRTYSSGMQMRLAFSIAIFSEPKILIVDEALSVGDAHFAQKCTKALQERKEKQMSIIYVSHDLSSLKLICDRLLLFNKGALIDSGTPKDIINHYNFLIAKLNDNEETLLIDNDQNTYGTHEVEIKSIKIIKENSEVKSIETGETVDIEIALSSKINVKDLTVGIQIKDKYAQHIYGTNTSYLNHTIALEADKNYTCTYQMQINIGEGHYTMGAAVHTGDWHTDRCYHWIENALEFQITSAKDNFFIGLCRMDPIISLKQH